MSKVCLKWHNLTYLNGSCWFTPSATKHFLSIQDGFNTPVEVKCISFCRSIYCAKLQTQFLPNIPQVYYYCIDGCLVSVAFVYVYRDFWYFFSLTLLWWLGINFACIAAAFDSFHVPWIVHIPFDHYILYILHRDSGGVNHYLRNRRWGGCIYVLQMFFLFFLFFSFFRLSKKYQTPVLGNGWMDFHETYQTMGGGM